MRLLAQDVSVDVEGLRIVTDVTLEAPSGSVVALVGPNGSGKSTLLRAVRRTLAPVAGRVLVGDDDVWHLSARQAARRTAAVLQDDSPDFEFTVREVVDLGRVPHRGPLGLAGAQDRAAVDEALAVAGVGDLADRYVATLSGGERQRVYLARALAQRTPVLVLDEPTNHLDLLAQTELLELLVDLPVTVVVALHDLNLAAASADRVVVLAAGRVVAAGRPDDVLTAALVEQVYGVRAQVGVNALTGRPLLHVGGPLRHRGRGPGLDPVPAPPTAPPARPAGAEVRPGPGDDRTPERGTAA